MPICNMCGEGFDVETAPGALLFGHPSTVKQAVPVIKAHICQECEAVIISEFKVPPIDLQSSRVEKLEHFLRGMMHNFRAQNMHDAASQIDALLNGPLPVPDFGESVVDMTSGTSVRDVAYGMGTETDEHSIGFCHGPTPNIQEMLELFGSTDRDVIVRFNADGTNDIIYRWREPAAKWMPEIGLKQVCPCWITDDQDKKVYCRKPLNHEGNHEAGNQWRWV